MSFLLKLSISADVVKMVRTMITMNDTQKAQTSLQNIIFMLYTI